MEDRVFIALIFLQYIVFDFYISRNFLHYRYKLIFSLSLIIFGMLSWQFANLAGVFILIAISLNFCLLVCSLKKYLFSFIYILGMYFFIQMNVACMLSLSSFFSQIETVRNPFLLLISLQILLLFLYFAGILGIKKWYNKNKISLFIYDRRFTRKQFIFFGGFLFSLIVYFQLMYSVLHQGFFWLLFIVLLMKGILFFGIFFFLKYSAAYYKDVFNIINFYEKKLERINELEDFKHDYEGILFTLAVLLEKGDTEGAVEQLLKIKDYSKDIIFSKNNTEELTKVRSMSVKSVLLIEVNRARNMGIKVKLSIHTEINELPMNPLDLARCLKILLDNAIEASIETKNPFIDLTINKQTDTYQILVKNNYTRTVLLDNLGKRGITSKEGHYGLGLSNLHRIAQEYKNLSYTIFQEETIFTVLLCLKE
ncbi:MULTISPECIES: sensor histidine kinase [unclassified Enterococcus]|uniref:sensor histidine kinase n=1 Tax=unclassified Enterococcus TaxID=2608891 RepID=UPI003D269DF3